MREGDYEQIINYDWPKQHNVHLIGTNTPQVVVDFIFY